jgi:hypothetical protein
MMKLTYTGTEERMFPKLGATLKQGDEVEAPEGFSHPDFTSGSRSIPKPSLPIEAGDK